MTDVLLQTDLPGHTLKSRGKVRDIYDLGDALLLVASDRLSAFDVVLPDGIPHKGRVLTQISRFWFEQIKDVVKNHIRIGDFADFPEDLKAHPELEGRAIIVEKAEPMPVECVVRGYITGSGWNDYQQTGQVCGIDLPQGLQEAQRLPEPLFTPSTKADIGAHDENIDFGRMVEIVGQQTATWLRDTSLAIYNRGCEIAEAKGVIIADTKFEFGRFGDEIILIDEVLTPDSSRFWPKDQYKPGGAQPSYDKQFVRDYLLGLNWDKTPPGPELPQELILKTSEKYLQALELFS